MSKSTLSTVRWLQQGILRETPIPWRWSDGEGPLVPFQRSNKANMDRMAEEWKLVDAVWDYDEWGYPPARTRLCDAAVFKLLVKKIPTRCSEQWPFDFDSRGQMRFEREPRGPTVWIEFGGRYYYPEIGGRYVLGGEVARTSGSWYIEPLYGVRRDVIYFGRVEVPSWAKDQGAIIVPFRSVPGLEFDDEKSVSWEGRSWFPIIWAKEVDLEDPTSLTRATVRTRVKTESGEDANLVDYGPDEEPEDTQSEVVNGSQRFHRPGTLKRKPEAPVNTHRKRGKAEIIDMTIENVSIESEVVSGSEELYLENRTAAEPLITIPQQQSSAHNNAPRTLTREEESRIITGHNVLARATSTASTQGDKTEPWVGTALEAIRQAASMNKEHQALIQRIGEAITSLQSRVEALEASAPLHRALQDVQKLMAEHQENVRGTAKIERAMEIILYQLPSSIPRDIPLVHVCVDNRRE